MERNVKIEEISCIKKLNNYVNINLKSARILKQLVNNNLTTENQIAYETNTRNLSLVILGILKMGEVGEHF